MSVEFANPEHLAFLVSKLDASDEEKEHLKRQALSPLSAVRLEAIQRIEQEMPGEVARIAGLYPVRGRYSVILWEISALRHSTAAHVRKLVKAAVHRSQSGDDAVESPHEDWEAVGAGAKGERARVLLVRNPDENLVEVVVRLTKERSIPYEGDEKRVPVSSDVTLILEQWEEAYVARVLSSQQDARKSVLTFTGWLLNQDVPTRAPRLHEFLRPLTFTEKDIAHIAKKLGMEGVGFHCEDPRGVVGEMAFYGKAEGHHLQPLDLTDRLVQSYNAAPQDIRTYNYAYTHPDDGFVEKTRVSFFFKSRPPHLTFDLRTSHLAASTLLHSLYAQVRP